MCRLRLDKLVMSALLCQYYPCVLACVSLVHVRSWPPSQGARSMEDTLWRYRLCLQLISPESTSLAAALSTTTALTAAMCSVCSVVMFG
jgi:hypothetical protein